MKNSRYNLIYFDLLPSKAVAYNTLTRAISFLRHDLAGALIQSCENTEDALTSFTKGEIEALCQEGFLVTRDLDEERKLTYRLYQTRFQTTSLDLKVLFTSQCNFSCSYCYQDTLTSERYMSEAQWAAIQMYIEHQIDQLGIKHISATLFGGEPLLTQDLAVQAARNLAEFRKRGITVKSTLITNGSLLTNSLLDQFDSSLDTIQITLDGPKARHNILRPFGDGRPSYHEVMKAIALSVKSSIPNVVIRINLHPEEASEVRAFICQISEEFGDLSRIGLSFSRIESTLSERHSIFEAKPDLENYTLMRSLSTYSAQVGFRSSIPLLPSGTCTAQRASSLVIDQDLNVFNCEAQMSHAPRARLSEHGTLSILQDEWFQLSNHIPACVYTCPYGPLCGGGCPIYPLSIPVYFPECEHTDYYKTKVEDILRARLQDSPIMG